jgi:hemolysin activation/secretion protein
MKRLLEWKQRMLQSPLTRKAGQRSERNTPTPQSVESPRLPQPSQSSVASPRVTSSHEVQPSVYINQVDLNGSRDPGESALLFLSGSR